jgi:hypothetical protein
MKYQFTKALLSVAFVSALNGCTSSPPLSESSSARSEQSAIEALKMANTGPVELTIGYCDSQLDLPARKQVVDNTIVAIFAPTLTAAYELKVRPLKLQKGKILTQITAYWKGKEGCENVLFSRQLIAKEGETGPKSVINVNGNANCFTITAQSVDYTNN